MIWVSALLILMDMGGLTTSAWSQMVEQLAVFNKASGLQNANQIKLSVGFDRANHRFADVNGDGRTDFLWIDKFSGNVSLWLNDGMIPVAGSSFKWTKAPGA
ncbi:hypothetical protein EJ04DRAFT_561556 [Polyplosphaeria fusca]|uniref:VCBS repeat-containing protein n=1 Tax=Polyplosphaeria fusca TaxID=682080 RepID=A0A9P4R653_9PLEO|nr:hypothetical protein EJ04DRAFT_561556 [Polyplosphaeria fusca]